MASVRMTNSFATTSFVQLATLLILLTLSLSSATKIIASFGRRS
jgi:hypothetical protein